MDQRDLTFVIPTYRLRDVGETVEQYDQHFWDLETNATKGLSLENSLP